MKGAAVFSQKLAVGVAGLLFCWASWPESSRADKRAIDVQRSGMKVYAYKSGLFSVFAHDHEILAPIAAGAVEESENPSVELVVETAKMQVLDPKASDKDRAEIQKTMVGPEVLDTARYLEIRFQSTAVERKGEARWTVRGNLMLHGQTRPIAVEVSGQNGNYRGSAMLKQTDFGIKPVSIAGGTVKVKDAVRIHFEIVLTE